MIVTLIVLGLAIIFFVTGKIRSDIVAICALLILMLCDILTPSEGLSGFSNPIVLMMVGLFIVGGGIFQTGLAKMISSQIMKLAGTSPLRLYLLVMLVTATIGAFVSNTGTVALMLPIVVSLAASANISSSRLLMPLAFASSMGGMMTLIGTPPNIVISEELVKNGHKALSFFSFTPVGLICIALGTSCLWFLSKKFLSKKENKNDSGNGKTLSELASKYQLSDNLCRVKVKNNSPLVGHTVQELNLTTLYNVNILEIRRKAEAKALFSKTVSQKLAVPSTVIQKNDVIYLLGYFEDVKNFAENNLVELMDRTDKSEGSFNGNLLFDEIGIAEVVIMSTSRLINQKVKDTGFRNKYNINILGIQRGTEYILNNVKDAKIASGDSLLVQGEWKDIAKLNDESAEWVVVGQPLSEASKVTLDYKAPLAAIILVAMVILMAFNIVPAVVAVLSAAVLMILTGCLRNVEAAYKTINWESIVLIGAMLPMSLALEKTGISTAISSALVNGLGSMGPIFILAGIYIGTSVLTMFISNTATAVLFAPIAMQSALAMDISPLPLLFAVSVSASMCFASPFSTPPNALVMSAGRYTFMDYVKVGLPLQVIFAIVMILVLPLLFPF